MPHIRQQIRQAIFAKCQAVPEVAPGQAFVSRFYKFNPEELPAINVFTDGEKLAPEAAKMNQPHIQRRQIRTTVMVMARASDDIEDALDAVALSVENEILNEATLGGLAIQTSLEGVDVGVLAGNEAQVGVMKMVFLSTVLTREGLAETVLGG